MKTLLILDTEQTYGDVGIIIVNDKEILKQEQLVISPLFDKLPDGYDKKRHQQEYSTVNAIFGTFSDIIGRINHDIAQYSVTTICTHNLTADRKVFNSWCAAAGLENPFDTVSCTVDSQEAVKFLSLTTNSYSLEDFVQNLGDVHFLQKHIGLADAEIVLQIVLAFGIDNFIQFFGTDFNTILKKYLNSDKTLMNIVQGGETTSVLGKMLNSMGYTSVVQFDANGKKLVKSKYTLNQKGKQFFNSTLKQFIQNKKNYRDNIYLSLIRSGIVQNGINDNTLQNIPAEDRDLLKQKYNAILQEQVNAKIKELDNVCANKMKEAYSQSTQIINSAKQQVKQKEEEYKYLLNKINNQKSALENDLNKRKEEVNNILDSIISQANAEAEVIIKKANAEAETVIQKANAEKDKIITDARDYASKVKYNSWVDRIFFPILGLFAAIVFSLILLS